LSYMSISVLYMYKYIFKGYIDNIEKVLLGEVVWVLKRLLGY
jgi:hypothetical protein